MHEKIGEDQLMPTVSVIIPAYKPNDFDSLLKSMKANNDVEAEWIVIDDGSGPEYSATFAQLHETPATVIIQPVNRGQAHARNIGLQESRGTWIKFLDADDCLDEMHLSELLQATRELPDKVIPFAPTKHVYFGGMTHINDSWRHLQADPVAQLCRQLVRPFLHHCGALFSRDLLVSIGGYDANLVTDEDGDLLLRILNLGYHFAPVEGVHYQYIHHQSGSRVSSDNSLAKMRARVCTCEKLIKEFQGKLPNEIADGLAQRMDKIALANWLAFPDEAKDLLLRARQLSPNYSAYMRGSLRLIRTIGGAGLVLYSQAFYRRFRGQPNGGAQG